MLRVNMSINIIAMVEPKLEGARDKSIAECVPLNFHQANITENYTESLSKHTALPDFGTRYDWSPQVQGFILGSYFWGYILTSIPGGYFAEKFSPTKTVAISGFISAVITVIIPLAASWHYWAVIVLRIILGLMAGVVYPSLHCLVAHWAPPTEKGMFTAALFGGSLGTVITWPLSGSIVQAWGWKWAFCIQGILAFIYCALWMLLVADLPDSHPRISEEEKIYISKSLGDNVGKNKATAPYLKMFTSIPFWALACLHFGNLWGLYLLLTAGPKFMSEVLGFNLAHSGVLAALPYLARMLLGFFFGFVGDLIRRRNWMTVTMIRKSFVTMSHFIPGLLLFGLIYVGCDVVACVALITLSLGLNGASTITNIQNNQDLAPNYAGTIYGMINCFGGTTGFFTPMITGYLTEQHSGLKEWHIIFSIGASVYIATGVIFCIFGSGQQQLWNQVRTSLTVGGVENPAFENASEVSAKETENTKI